MITLELAIQELKSLPQNKIKEAVHFIHSLKEKTLETRNKMLEETSGWLSDEEADEWWKTIKEDCRRMDTKEPPSVD